MGLENLNLPKLPDGFYWQLSGNEHYVSIQLKMKRPHLRRLFGDKWVDGESVWDKEAGEKIEAMIEEKATKMYRLNFGKTKFGEYTGIIE